MKLNTTEEIIEDIRQGKIWSWPDLYDVDRAAMQAAEPAIDGAWYGSSGEYEFHHVYRSS